MFQLLFAIALMLSAFGAWRRNPLSSRVHMLRSIVVILLAIAGAVLLLVAVVNLTINKSTAVSASALAAVVVVDTLALIFIVQAATVPRESKPASLPHAVRLVTVNRKKVYTWAKVFAFILVLSLVPGLLIRSDIRYAFLVCAGLTAFLAIIILPVLYWTNRGFDQALTAVELDPWVHWQYTPEQWTAWCSVQAERLKATPPNFILTRDWRRLWPLLVVVVGVYVFDPGSWGWKTIYIVAVCGGIMALGIFGGHTSARQADKLRLHLQAAAPEAYLGRDGVFCDGIFTPWLNVSTYLVSAALDPREPRSIMFNFERSVPNPYGPVQLIHIHQAVLIPDGKQDDVARIQRELQTRCPSAQVRLI